MGAETPRRTSHQNEPAVFGTGADGMASPLHPAMQETTTLTGRAPERPRQWLLGILLIIFIVMQVGTAGVGDLYNETDGQYAGAALAMVRGGDWMIPYNNEVPRLVKPPLMYWMMSGSFMMFGVNEFAARLPNVIGIGLMAWFVFLIGERLASLRTGFVASLIFLLLPGTAILGRVVMPEPLFCAGIAASMYALVRLREGGVRIWIWLFWGGAAGAMLVKGSHGALIPIAVAVLSAWRWKECRPVFKRLLHFSAVLAVLIQLPWLIYIESKFPGFWWEWMVNQQIGHVLNTRWPPMPEAVPRLQFFVLHLAWFFPWIFFAAIAASGWKSIREAWNHFESGFPWLWALLIFAAVGAAGQRQDYYAMSAWPAVALLMAGCWRHPEMGRRIAWTAAGFALFFLAALVALLCVAIPTESASELQDAGARATAFSALATLPPATWRELRQSGLLTFGIFAGGFLAAWWNGRKGDSTRVLPLVALTTAAACLMAIHSVAAVAPFFSSAQAARALSPLLHQEDRVIFDGDPPLASSLCFYLPQPFYYTGTEANYEFAVQTTGLGKDRFLSEDEVLTHWKKGGGVYLIIERERVTFWQSLLGEWRVIQKFGSQKIISPPLPDDPQS